MKLFLVIITALFCQCAAHNELWWPLTFLRLGTHRPQIKRHSPSIRYYPKPLDQYMRYSYSSQQQQIGGKWSRNWWDKDGFRKTNHTKTTRATATTTVPSTTAITPSNLDCSRLSTTQAYQPALDLKFSSNSRSCAPGTNCRLHLRSFQTADPLFQYAYFHSTPMEPVLQSIFESARSSIFAPPLSSETAVPPEVVKLNMALIKALKANRVLVIGVHSGLSVVGAALSVVHGGQVVGVEDPQNIKYWNSIGSKNAFEAGLAKTIVIQASGPINDYLGRLAAAQPLTFDFVFIDDPDVENYLSDYELSLRLLRPRGVMLVNNIFAEGAVLSGLSFRDKAAETISFLNRKVRDDVRLDSAVMLPFGGGVLMLVKK